MVYGPLNRSQVIQPRVLHVRDSHSLKEFHKLVQEFGVRSSSLVLDSVDNRLVRKVMEDTTKKIAGKYEVVLLWRSDATVRMKRMPITDTIWRNTSAMVTPGYCHRVKFNNQV